MARYKAKELRSTWSEASIKLSLTAVKSGKMKRYKAAKHYNVPRRSLRRYLLEERETKSTLDRKPLLNPEPVNLDNLTQVDRSIFIKPQPSVYDDSDSSDEIPLSKLNQTNRDSKTESRVCSTILNESYSSFCEILRSPEKMSSPKTKPRAKAINSLAQELTKSMFVGKNNKLVPSKSYEQKIENMPGPSRVSSQKRKQYSPKMNKTETANSKVSKNKGERHHKKSKDSWYCYVCNNDRIADMRLCFLCKTYVHEECVGLTKEDADQFVCTRCSQD